MSAENIDTEMLMMMMMMSMTTTEKVGYDEQQSLLTRSRRCKTQACFDPRSPHMACCNRWRPVVCCCNSTAIPDFCTRLWVLVSRRVQPSRRLCGAAVLVARRRMCSQAGNMRRLSHSPSFSSTLSHSSMTKNFTWPNLRSFSSANCRAAHTDAALSAKDIA